MTTAFDTALTTYLTYLFGAPLNTATSQATAEVPRKWHVAIDGVGFMLAEFPKWKTLATLRAQQDSREAGELSLNPEGLWRRSASSWDHGAGQTRYDDAEASDRRRFRSSKGVNPWTPGQVTLLNDTEQVRSVAGSIPQIGIAGNLYWADGSDIYKSDLSTNTAITMPATVSSLCSVGSYILAACGASGIRKIAASASTEASWVTGTVDVVGFAKGRVLAAAGAALYNPTTALTGGPAALPAALYTQPDSTFTWVGFAEGTSWIYAAGNVGDKGLIYKTAVKADGTALDTPTVAGRCEDGETITSIYGYLGTLLIGTSLGIRIGVPNSSGDLELGAAIPVGTVYTMLGRLNYVYFGWSNYDGTSTGLGRIDLAALTDTQRVVPAYATDLMVTGQGTVRGIGFYSNRLIIGVAGLGVYKQSDNLVQSGTIDSGLIGFGITEDKTLVGGLSNYTGSGTVTLQCSTEGATFDGLAESGEQLRGQYHELRVTLTRGSTTAGPTLTLATLYGFPCPQGTMMITLACEIDEASETKTTTESTNPVERLGGLRDLWLTRRIAAVQLGDWTFQGIVEALEFDAQRETRARRGWVGTATVALKVLP